jgi:hypothetical protein
MIALTICIIVMLYMLDRLRLESHAIDKMESSYAMFGVRDMLRAQARSGVIRYDDWFTYMDTTISRTIAEIDQVTVWHGLGYMLVYQKDDRVNRARTRLKEHLKKDHALAEIEGAYLHCIRQILKKRHAFFWFCVQRSRSSIGRIARTKKQIVDIFASAPETSTLLKYARAR